MARKAKTCVIVGGGHNGLTCASYLAGAGFDVTVLEKRSVVGGAAITEEFTPGFRNSALSYAVSLLPQKIIDDLRLREHGLRIVDRSGVRCKRFIPAPNGADLLMPSKIDDAAALLDKTAPGDGDAYRLFETRIAEIAKVVKGLMLEQPPNIRGGIGDIVGVLMTAGNMSRLDQDARETLIKLFTSSVGDYLNSIFKSDVLKGMLAYSSVSGNFQSPYSAGSAYVLLHHALGEIDGKTGVWGHAMGGMGAITDALSGAAAERGVKVRVDSPVSEILLDGNEAKGVRLADGETIECDLVAANVNPKLLYLQLMDPNGLPADFKTSIENWRCRSGILRLNVALSELPNYTCRPGADLQPHHAAPMATSFSIDYLDKAYDDAKAGHWASEPIIELNIPSTIDPDLAKPGCHVASLYCQHFHPELSDGRDWDDVKDEAIKHVFDYMDTIAPNFSRSVIGMKAYSPKDLEREFSLIGGDIFHGALHLDQIYSQRPATGYAGYNSPVDGLYLCGAGSHPGGGV
ncbi:MAG: NAD(P)/FAD-dependent oxidoreductase [Pseudomonadota bacterium]